MLPVVLVVEDQPILLRTYGRMLKSPQYELVLASTPKQALNEALRAGDRLKVLITDQNLNGKGEALADNITSRFTGVRVLVTSGDAYLKTKYEVLVKPFDMSELQAKIFEKLGFSE
jgi:DNA-binding NtrC family response regulator